MKILHLTPFYPPHVGGLQSHAAGFNLHLAAPNTPITTVTAQLPHQAASRERERANSTVVRLPAVELIPNYPIPALWRPSFWSRARAIRVSRHQIIISRTRFFTTALAALILAKTTNITWLHIEHGSDFVSLANPITNAFARWYDYTLGRLVLRSADMVVANSKASARFVRRLSGRQAKIIYRGVDKEAIASVKQANLATTHNLHPTIIKIVFVGRLIDGKGVDDLLHALKSLPIDYKLLLVGSGSQERHLMALARQLHIAERVLFLGEKSFQQTIGILKASDIFVNPSHTEGLPTSVIEAALCKIAIVATGVGGTPEIISNEKSGYLVPPRKPNLIAKKIRMLTDNPQRKRTMIEQAYREVNAKFDWDVTAKHYRELFSQVESTP